MILCYKMHEQASLDLDCTKLEGD